MKQVGATLFYNKVSKLPSTPTSVGETQMLPHIKDITNQLLVKKLTGSTKSQFCGRRVLTLADFFSRPGRRLRRPLVLLEQRRQAEAVALLQRRKNVDRRRRHRKLSTHASALLPVCQPTPGSPT